MRVETRKRGWCNESNGKREKGEEQGRRGNVKGNHNYKLHVWCVETIVKKTFLNVVFRIDESRRDYGV